MRTGAFVVMLAVLVAAIALAPVAVVRPILDGTAQIAHALLDTVGVNSVLDGNLILMPERTLLVSRDCTAAYLLAVYTSLVMCYRASRRDKLRALTVGVPVLLAANMARIVGAGVVAKYSPASFEVMHDYVFVVALMFAVIALWLFWIRTVKSGES
jgi:exosortase/archaeosortase family protein